MKLVVTIHSEAWRIPQCQTVRFAIPKRADACKARLAMAVWAGMRPERRQLGRLARVVPSPGQWCRLTVAGQSAPGPILPLANLAVAGLTQAPHRGLAEALCHSLTRVLALLLEWRRE